MHPLLEPYVKRDTSYCIKKEIKAYSFQRKNFVKAMKTIFNIIKLD